MSTGPEMPRGGIPQSRREAWLNQHLQGRRASSLSGAHRESDTQTGPLPWTGFDAEGSAEEGHSFAHSGEAERDIPIQRSYFEPLA